MSASGGSNLFGRIGRKDKKRQLHRENEAAPSVSRRRLSGKETTNGSVVGGGGGGGGGVNLVAEDEFILPNYETVPPPAGEYADVNMREDFGEESSISTTQTAADDTGTAVAVSNTPTTSSTVTSHEAETNIITTSNNTITTSTNTNTNTNTNTTSTNTTTTTTTTKLLPKTHHRTVSSFSFDMRTPSEIYFNNDPMTIRIVPPMLQYIPSSPNNVHYVQKAIDNLKYYLQNIIDYRNVDMMTFFISYDVNQEHKIYFEEIVMNLLAYGANKDNANHIIDLFENYYMGFTNILDVLLNVVVNVNYSTNRPREITYSLINFINACAQHIENKIEQRLVTSNVSKNLSSRILYDEDVTSRVQSIQIQLTGSYNSKLIQLQGKRLYKYTADNADDTFDHPMPAKNFTEQILELEYDVEMVNTDLYV
ncbi:hypothetical protein SlsnVgp042 [Spodoptera littoralis nucleopolyhedrovirus]|uniref:Uncharacterized protein n=1 Tax=Spodoptera littoralis nuclear polyhedrosis virus TaxID=10456 RepID=M1JSG6_NPVSL|nr:hypothetical protein SlsnVgp042 [Spodoptera littoralis nucleopolyhedrovirus]AGE89897.1 hypothetical protein SlsnVgp042 [Spodoptera littoralis nucleopolyhedrovirus]